MLGWAERVEDLEMDVEVETEAEMVGETEGMTGVEGKDENVKMVVLEVAWKVEEEKVEEEKVEEEKVEEEKVEEEKVEEEKVVERVELMAVVEGIPEMVEEGILEMVVEMAEVKEAGMAVVEMVVEK